MPHRLTSAASYQNSWGGPGLAGVFAVHSGPGPAVVLALDVQKINELLRERGVERGFL